MWNLYNENKFLEPLCFSNGKSQKDIVKEVLDSIKQGKDTIFIRGVCGTGKSAIALNIAKNLGKTSIVVPGKNLQSQYKKDYESSKYLLKENGEKLKISVITGRNNHQCKFLEDNKLVLPTIKREINSKLDDIFSFEEKQNPRKEDSSAANNAIPCKIELKEKNFRKIKEYLKQNKDVDSKNFQSVKDVKRISVAAICPYWSPVVPEKYELTSKGFKDINKRTYMGLNDTKFIFYQRRPGCKFYEQFNSYIDSDVIVFNSLKYKLETVLNRKPATEVEIIDECDEFLDSFSTQRNINLDRLQNSLNYIYSIEPHAIKTSQEINSIIQDIKRDKKIEAAIYSNMILPLKETKLYDLLKVFLSCQEFLFEVDDESYILDVEETARMFEGFLEDTYLTFNKKEGNIIISLVTTNLAKKFKELKEKNKIIVLMSGTLHSEDVLKKVFGLENFKVIDAEIKQQGIIEVHKTGLEKDCKYQNFAQGEITRESYLKSLSKCVDVAAKPLLIHVNSFADLPSKEELEKFDIDNLISREKLKDIQKEDSTGKLVERFKKKQVDVLFSTRTTRGIDFPGDECRSIIFTKYPNPDVKGAFWRILKQTQPNQ